MGGGTVGLSYGLLVLAICLLAIGVVGQKQCTKVDDCKCTFDDGSHINLWPLTEEGIRDPRFKRIVGPDDTTIEYNPCIGYNHTGINGSSECADVAVCQVENINNITKGLGHPDASFIYDAEVQMYAVRYNKDNITTTILLDCTNEISSTVTLYKSNATSYSLKLTSPTSCVKGENEKHGPSPGTVILIILAVVSLVYICGGIIYQKCEGAVGLEIIPNHEFWLDLPLLLRDGVVFLLSGCKPQVAYDRI